MDSEGRSFFRERLRAVLEDPEHAHEKWLVSTSRGTVQSRVSDLPAATSPAPTSALSFPLVTCCRQPDRGA